MDNVLFIFLVVLLLPLTIIVNAEGIEYDEKIVLIIGKNGGEPDVEIAKRIWEGLHNHGFYNIHIRTDDSINEPELNTSHLVLIGGPGINQITQKFLPDLDLQFYEISQPSTKDPQQHRKWDIVNIKTKENYGSNYSPDFGLGFIYNLYSNEKDQHVFVISGIEAIGTQSAADYFFSQECYEHVGDVEFIVINMNISQNKEGCAEKIDLKDWSLNEKIFNTSQIPSKKNDLKVVKIIKNNGVEKSTFYPGDEFEIEIKLENRNNDSIQYSLKEPLLYFLTLKNIYPYECQQNSKLHCVNLINQNETTVINYKGTISDKTELGNVIFPKTLVEYFLKNNPLKQHFAESNDLVVRIQDPIKIDAEVILDKNIVKTGDTLDVKLILENKGIQLFYANSTLLLDERLEFQNPKNKSMINMNFGPIKPGESKELSFTLHVTEGSQLVTSEKQTIEFTTSAFNTIYNGSNWHSRHIDSSPRIIKDIVVEISTDRLFWKPLIENWPFLLFIAIGIFLSVQFKRKHFPFKPYKSTISEF